MAMPSIACLGVIGKNNNPLHITIFPSHLPVPSVSSSPIRTPLQFSLLLSSALDTFEARRRSNPVASTTTTTTGATGTGTGFLSGDYGLLQALDERLVVYGFETNTGAKFVAVVDLRGRRLKGIVGGGEEGLGGEVGGGKAVGKGGKAAGGAGVGLGLREGEMKVVFRTMQAAYVRLLQNPFYDPDEHSPAMGKGGKKITSRRFAADMQRIGDTWMPGKITL